MQDYSHHINRLFQLYLSNKISHDEYHELLALLNVDSISNSLALELKDLWIQSKSEPMALSDEEWNKKIQFLIRQLNEGDIKVTPVRKLTPLYKLRWAAAVVILLILSSGINYLFKTSKSSLVSGKILAKKNTAKGVMPGGNKAILILADGTSIVLDSSSNGTIASQGATKIIKLNTGQLIYNSSNADQNTVSYNILSTPYGGQYQVTLPDGTIVWLNSASNLRYPTSFTGHERRVEITGEAYFEVAKNARQPFKVKINLSNGEGSEVEVLGTHFNINAYDDETTIRTTLFEGSVKINQSTGTTQIKPGQQLQTGKTGQIKIINNADLEETIAWKEGRFQFGNADINCIMRQLARWYDIDVKYEGNISRHFSGIIPRNVNLLKVLNMLELTGEVNFKVEGKKVMVIP